MSPELAREVLTHHLRLFGLRIEDDAHKFALMMNPGAEDIPAVRDIAEAGGVVVAILPKPPFQTWFKVSEFHQAPPPAFVNYRAGLKAGRGQLKSLHPATSYRHYNGESVMTCPDGTDVWTWIPILKGGVLFVGTDVAADLVRYRQGSPESSKWGANEVKWGIPGERPNYLFDPQLEGEDGTHRHADWWAIALAETVAARLKQPLAAILPDDAPGAIVITGDDDQAYLEKYQEQLALVGKMPITYLLHPLTRHTAESLAAMRDRYPGVDLGIHPDALETPNRYAELFDEQVEWYRTLTAARPISLRNHGFLNDGYWGHLNAWLKHGIAISSNLPGFDGRILNGSLLPARMVWNGALTRHWSVLTVIGDGIRFAGGLGEHEAADCLWNVADRITQSRLPGVMVVNLHPQNVSETRTMHAAAVEIARSGFVAWNLRQCWEWFSESDQGQLTRRDKPQGWFRRFLRAMDRR